MSSQTSVYEVGVHIAGPPDTPLVNKRIYSGFDGQNSDFSFKCLKMLPKHYGQFTTSTQLRGHSAH